MIVEDTYGNTVTGDSSSVTISSSTTAFTGSMLSVNASSGVATFSVIKPMTAGSANTLTASDSENGGLAGATSSTFTVNAGTLDHFGFAAIGAQTAGTAFPITITAQDVNNNTVTSYAGTVNLTTTAGTITPSPSAAFSSGVLSSYNVTVTQSGILKTITATDAGGSGKTGTSSSFTVNPGAVSAAQSTVTASPASVPQRTVPPLRRSPSP